MGVLSLVPHIKTTHSDGFLFPCSMTMTTGCPMLYQVIIVNVTCVFLKFTRHSCMTADGGTEQSRVEFRFLKNNCPMSEKSSIPKMKKKRSQIVHFIEARTWDPTAVALAAV